MNIENMPPRVLGIIGGMGPLATADLMSKITFASSAKCDQDQLPVLVWSMPQVPDPTNAFLQGESFPLSAMLEGVRALKSIGAQAIAIADNSAHYWHDELELQGGLPVLNMVDATAEVVRQRSIPSSVVALAADEGTISSGLYQRRIDDVGFGLVLPTARDQAALQQAVALVKGGDLVGANNLVDPVARRLLFSGANLIIVGNCELQIALARSQNSLRSKLVDATGALAAACVAWCRGEATLGIS